MALEQKMYYEDRYNDTIEDMALAIEGEAPSMVTFAVILTVWSYLVNMFLIVIILRDVTVKHRTFNLQIVNLSVTNVLVSVLVMPLTIYNDLHPWMLGLTLCKTYIFLDVILPYISLIVILFIDSLYLMKQYNISFVNSESTPIALNMILTIMPWLLGVVIVSSVWAVGEQKLKFIPGLCWFMLKFEASVISPILTFFIPAICSFIFTTLICVNNLKKNFQESEISVIESRNTDTYQAIGNRQNSTKPPISTLALSLVNISWIVLSFPNKVITFQMVFCADCLPPLPVVVAFVWLGASSSAITPLMWFTDSNIRQMIRHQIKKCFKRKQSSDISNIIDLEDMSAC